MSEKQQRVLVVGGSGYLGQHLLQSLSTAHYSSTFDLAFTYNSFPPQQLLDSISPCLSFQIDVQTGQGFDSIAGSFGQPHVVVNCAAISVPRACEVNPTAAMAINVPSSLVKWLSRFGNSDTLLIHLSTDQVYEGRKPYYREEDETVPVNMYGKSKLAAEQFISLNWCNYAILRSSIIYGPQTISPVSKSLPIQWIDSVLSQGDKTDFFEDEYRCPVYVKDVVDAILALTKMWISDNKQKRLQLQLLLNVGGPDRLSRVQMAEAVAEFRQYNTSLIRPVPASSVNRGVISPADISMNISKLMQVLGVNPVCFKEGMRLTLSN